MVAGADLNAESFTLDNGMQVVLIPDRQAYVLAHAVWYKVGAADDPAGKSGVAHLLEHLTFRSTNVYPGGDLWQMVRRSGNHENASTS